MPLLAVLGGVLATACRLPEPRSWPFPEARARDAEAVLATLRERTERARSMYAELTMSVEGEARSGVFDTVVHYQAPGRLRLTAFKDLLVTTGDIFDLAVSGDSYALRMDEGTETRRERGRLSDLSAAGGAFEAFATLRERLFLPGRTLPGEAVGVAAGGEELTVTMTSEVAGRIVYHVDAATLGVRSARAWSRAGRAPIEIDYLSYREVDGVFVPERFGIVDRAGGFSLSGWLRHVEVNPELDQQVFEDLFEREASSDGRRDS